MMAADGSGAPVLLARGEAGTLYPSAWSPDGKTIAFIRELPHLSLQSVATAPPHDVRPLAAGAGAQVEASFSPDGRWIAHVSFDGSLPEIVVGPASTPERRWPVAPRGRYPVWNPNGREVLFLESDAIYAIAIAPATGLPVGRVTKVIDLPAASVNSAPQLSPDGRRFLMLERVAQDAPAPELRVVVDWLDDVRAKMAAARPLPKPTR
jgi:Tol biopolymer transport system component